MTSKEFFKKENIIGSGTFDNVEFKDEFSAKDYGTMGAIALSRAFVENDYLPLASGLAVEYAIVISMLGIEIDGEAEPDDVFKAFVCYGLYDKFVKHFGEANECRARIIMRAEVDLAELIENRKKEIDKGKTFLEQIKSVFEKIATDETLLSKIDALVGEIE